MLHHGDTSSGLVEQQHKSVTLLKSATQYVFNASMSSIVDMVAFVMMLIWAATADFYWYGQFWSTWPLSTNTGDLANTAIFGRQPFMADTEL